MEFNENGRMKLSSDCNRIVDVIVCFTIPTPPTTCPAIAIRAT